MSVIGKPPGTVCNCAAIRQAARRVTRLYDQALAPSGLRVTQFSLLATLAGGEPVTMRVLADRLVMDRATLGHNIRPLEAQGLLTMTAGQDRRSKVIALTDAGKRRLAAARPAWKAAQTAFESSYGIDEAASLRTTMEGLARVDFGPAAAIATA